VSALDFPLAGPSPRRTGTRLQSLRRGLRARPEVGALVLVAAVLNLWDLSRNGWANTYYSAAVRSMAASWHNFLFASMDPSGLMTVDKPPLALWVQALSARVFGLQPLSVLVPQALMGVAATVLVYDLTRRPFGRAAGFVAGLVLATTPVIVAVSRHNNPDELLVLCCTAAVWCAVRALEDGRTRWLVLSAVCAGLGFETKMLVAMMVVPGIAVAWLWCAPLALGPRVRRLLSAGAAGSAVALAWPLLVTLIPAADRPWISGTSDNSVWSLIFGYNGIGRVAGQSGGPPGATGGAGFGLAGPGGTLFGGATGPFRLLDSGLGDQAGWLLGLAFAAAVALLVLTRLRRGDPRSGWLIAVGGALATSAVVFSFARGIFHPYYVSFFAPYAAAFVGAGTALSLRGRALRVTGPLVLGGGVLTELVVLGGLSGQLSWARPLAFLAGAIAAGLALPLLPRVRGALVAGALALLLAGPAAWAAQTLGHATNGTFPAGGPASAQAGGGPGGRFAGFRHAPGGRGTRFGSLPPGLLAGAGGVPGGPPAAGFAPPSGVPGGGFAAPTGGLGGGFGGPGLGPAGGFGGPGGGFGGDSAGLQEAIRYARAHGGGTVGVESQSAAAAAILDEHADVAGLGGFSGRESAVSARWLAAEVAAGRLRWVLAATTGPATGVARLRGTAAGGSRGLPGDTRTGSRAAFTAVARACRVVRLSQGTLYDCQGRAAAIARAG